MRSVIKGVTGPNWARVIMGQPKWRELAVKIMKLCFAKTVIISAIIIELVNNFYY
jgi:hypothetical protein